MKDVRQKKRKKKEKEKKPNQHPTSDQFHYQGSLTTEYIKATKKTCTARSSEYHLAGGIQFYSTD